MLLSGFPAHTHRLADGGVAGPALTAPHTLLVVQVNVHQQFAGFEAELEYLVGNGEHCTEHLAGEPGAFCGYPAATGCCATALAHFSLDGTQRVGECLPVLLQFDEPSLSQCAQVCTYRFLTPTNCFANNGATHFVCPMSQALAVDQIEIHQ